MTNPGPSSNSGTSSAGQNAPILIQSSPPGVIQITNRTDSGEKKMTMWDENGPVTPTRPKCVAQAKAVAKTTAAQNVRYLLLSTGIGLSALLTFLVLNAS